MSPPAGAAGFTLIEVLAALVIVALGMLGVIEAVTQNARNGSYLREKTLAHWIAMNVITERRLQPSPPEIAETSDEIEYAGERWRWTLRVSETPVESMRRMDVFVRPADAPEDQALATLTGFYGSAIGAAGGSVLDWNGVPPGSGPSGEEAEEEGEDGKDGAEGTPPAEQPPSPERPGDEDDEAPTQ
ncbi:MAG TPA: type II secretion system minor pseudopilin GspI [Steroidobacteraceae bacterium]|nr:type II secretion system minor pseudopilin GspI [Steroidobacteraceae bacterium]